MTIPKTRVTARHGNRDDVWVSLTDGRIFRLPPGDSITVPTEDFAEADGSKHCKYTITQL